MQNPESAIIHSTKPLSWRAQLSQFTGTWTFAFGIVLTLAGSMAWFALPFVNQMSDQSTVDAARTTLLAYNHEVLSETGKLPRRIATIYRETDGTPLQCMDGTHPTVTYGDILSDAVVTCSGTHVTSIKNPGTP